MSAKVFLDTNIFSEDMSDGQVIEDRLRIINPFKQM
jgi:predicted nucleic acid-binding protein